MKKIHVKLINLKLYFILTLSFVLFTIIGTLSHELSHYVTAKYLGYAPIIHFDSVSYNSDETLKNLEKITQEHLYEFKNNIDFPEKENYIKISSTYFYNHFLLALAGPIQTLLTGSIGFILFLIYKKKIIYKNAVTFYGWLLILMSLFWLRQIFNLFTSLYTFLNSNRFPIQSDEAKINNYLNLPHFTTECITATIALLVLLIIIKNIPRNLIITFILSGLSGGLLGFYLWFFKIGKLIIP